MSRLAAPIALLLAALAGCKGDPAHPPLAPGAEGGPRHGVPPRIGGGDDIDAGRRDGAVPDGGTGRPAWCFPNVPGAPGSSVAMVTQAAGSPRAFTPARVFAKWSSAYCEPPPDDRRFLRIGLTEDDDCHPWSLSSPEHELFLLIDVDAIRAGELAPRDQPIDFTDDRVQIYYTEPAPIFPRSTIWGVCDAAAGGRIDFERIGANLGDPIRIVFDGVELTDCADKPVELPVLIDAVIDVTLQHTEAQACPPR